MKKLKKMLSVILTLAMVLGMSATTFAANPGKDGVVGTKDDTGTITLTGIEEEEGIEIALYPVMQAQYDETNGNFTGYEAKYTVPQDEDGNYTVDANTLKEIVEAVQNDANAEAINGVTWSFNTTANGYVSSDTVPVGMYLVAVTGAEAKIYNYAVASVYYENKNGGNAITGGTVDYIYDALVALKVSDNPEVTKSIKEEDNKVSGGSVKIGDNVNYEVEINPVPYYGGEHPVLNVTDTLSAGLTLNKDSVVITAYQKDQTTGTTLTNITPTTENNVLKVNFVSDTEGYLLNDYVGGKVIISYSAELNNEAVINQGGNDNDVVLKYTKDSKVETDDDDLPSDDDKTYTYTFDIDGNVVGSVTEGILTKYGEEKDTITQENLPLENAEFTLYTDEACTTVYTNKSEVDDQGTTFNGTVKSDAKGQLPIKGLAAGTYYLKETTAPTGYSLNTHVFTIEISAKYYGDADVNNGQIQAPNKKGQLASWSIKIDGKDIATFTVDNGNATTTFDKDKDGVGIQNTKISSLPSTGGIGTTIFTIGGCAIMILAAALYFASRRKSAK